MNWQGTSNPLWDAQMLRSYIAPLLLAGSILLVPRGARAQDPCPSASGADAEAGWTAYQAGEMTDARLRFEAAIERCDNDQYARTGLAYVELRNGNTQQASTLLEQVVRAEPNNIDALVGLGLAAWRSGDLGSVRSRFERVLALQPDHPTALEYMALVTDAERPAAGPTDPADQAWSAGDTETARRLYTARLDADPLDGLAMLRLGLVRAWAGEYGAALALLDLLVDLEPTNVDGRLARARVYAWGGDLPRAQAEVDEILGIVPDNADALAARALFRSWAGDVEGALESYDDLLSVAPEHGATRRQYAQALSWVSEVDRSVETYVALVEENPRDVDARLGLGRALAARGQFDRSLAAYAVILQDDPDEMRAILGRTRTLMWAGRLVESERSALAALERDDANGDAWGVLGQVYRAQGRDAAALEALENAEDFDPTDADVRDQLRSVRYAFAPRVRPTVLRESDSDGNTMWTATFDGHWHASPRARITGVATVKELEQTFADGALQRRSVRGMLRGRVQLWPGWVLTGGLGGHGTDADGVSAMWAADIAVRTPDRLPFGVTVSAASNGLDETATLATRGIRTTAYTLAGRWYPDSRWRLDGSVTTGSYQGDESNGRRAATLSASRRMTQALTLGTSFRGFSFERNLAEGYFDPDFYGVLEVVGSWRTTPLPWTVVLELAPGVQRITSDGDPGGSIRGSGRLGYRIGDGREITFGVGYSSAGLASFATGADGYRYTVVSLGVNWIV